VKLRTLVACSFLLVAPAMLAAADPDPADLLGRWELTEEVAKIPKGTIFDFQKDGKLIVTAEGKKEPFEFGYELKKNVLKIIQPDKTSHPTEIVTLNKMELVCKDSSGAVGKFKRLTDEKKEK